MKTQTLVIGGCLVIVVASASWYFLRKKTTGLIYNKDLSIATSPLAEAHVQTAAELAAAIAANPNYLQDRANLVAFFIDPKLGTPTA